jgi:MFS family permease
VIRHNSNLRLVAALMAAQTVVAGASLVYEVSIALDLLDLGEAGLGLLDAVLGIGGIIGGFVVLLLARRQRLAGDFGIGVILWAAPLLLIVAFPSVGTTLVAMFLIGLANSIVDVNAFTIVQRVAPVEVMGRVFGALESLLTVGMAVGALLMPLLIELVGLRSGLAAVGGAVSLAGLAGLAGLRRIDETALAPSGLALVRGVPMLAVLPPPVQERLAHVLVPVTVPPAGVVMREGELADRFWIIERGEAIVSRDGETLRRLGAGDSFGEIALLRDVPRTATVEAGDEDLVLRGLDRDEFIPAVTGHGEAHAVADAVVERWLALG